MKDNLVSTEEQSLITNCELEWVKVKLPKNKDLYVGNFYMPHRNLSDMKELDRSLQQLFNTPKPKSTVLVGDFNCPDIDWSTHIVKADASDKAVQQALIDTTSANLTQIHESPTREHNILDLVFTSNPTLVKSSISIPGLSDHEAIVTDIDIKPVNSQKQRRKIYKYSKANWTAPKLLPTLYQKPTVTTRGKPSKMVSLTAWTKTSLPDYPVCVLHYRGLIDLLRKCSVVNSAYTNMRKRTTHGKTIDTISVKSNVLYGKQSITISVICLKKD